MGTEFLKVIRLNKNIYNSGLLFDRKVFSYVCYTRCCRYCKNIKKWHNIM